MNMKFEHAPGGAMAIHAKVPNQLVFKADGTLESATKPDLKTASPETLATVGAVREMNRMPLFFQGIHNGTREGLQRVYKGCATPNDAIQISALTHPELVKAVLRGDVATCDEAAFQADPYQRGKWSRGTAYLDGAGKPQGWVRTPDLNQAMADSLPPPFARGGADAAAGWIGKDKMRNLVGHFVGGGRNPALNMPLDRPLGVFAVANADWGSSHPASATGNDTEEIYKFDASLGLPAGHTGTEFAPWHIYGVSYSITSNGVFNEGAIDAEQVMGEVLHVAGRVQAIENGGLMTVIYPNGSKAAPATIAVSTRIVVDNPFPGHHVMCEAEIFVAGNWGRTGWHFSSVGATAHGVLASEYGAAAEYIVIQSASNLLGASVNGGDPFGRNPALTTPSPLRVKVIKGAPV